VLAFGLVYGPVIGVTVGVTAALVAGVEEGLRLGLAAGAIGVVGMGLIGVSTSVLVGGAWVSFTLARCWLAFRRRLPWRLMAFLADAHEQRGVLRQAGGVYQFRHLELQRRLAYRHETILSR